VPELNVFSPEWDGEVPEIGRRAIQLGAKIGSRDLGVSLFELAPGGAVSPLHFHHANEELLLVLAGRVRVRTPGASRDLEAGAIVAFARGVDGAHQITNPGDQPARVLVFSTMNFPEVTEIVETGTTVVRTEREGRTAFPQGSDEDFMTLWLAAFDADGA
jgi:uncharacterized cupin superfamily protein